MKDLVRIFYVQNLNIDDHRIFLTFNRYKTVKGETEIKSAIMEIFNCTSQSKSFLMAKL